MNEENVERMLAEADDAKEEVGERMWHKVMADTVLVLLERDGEVTKGSLQSELEARSDNEDIRLHRATLRGALKALAGNPPRD